MITYNDKNKSFFYNILSEKEAIQNRDLLIKQIIEAKTKNVGYSFVRIGDGEARVLSYNEFSPLELYEEFLSYQFGVLCQPLVERFGNDDLDSCIVKSIIELRNDLIKSIEISDALGVLSETTFNSFETTSYANAIKALVSFTLARNEYIDNSKLLLSTYVFTEDSIFTFDFFKRLFELKFDQIYLLTSHSNLPEILEKKHGQDFILIKCPGHATFGVDETKGSYPEFYDSVIEIAKGLDTNSLFLSSGGFIGKLFAPHVKQLNGIFLDIGALTDGWIGKGLPYIKDQNQFRII